MRAILSIPKGKIRSPWFGIPVEGARPIVLATEQVRGALAGVEVTDTALIETSRAATLRGESDWNHDSKRGEAVRAVEVSFTHKHGGGKVRLYDLGEVTMSIHNWAEKQRERLAKNGNGLSARARKVAVMVRRLEKEKRGLYLHVPLHPLLPRESHVYEGSARYLRDSEWRWHAEKPQRRQIAGIAGKVLRNRITATTGYKLLRDAGFKFDRFSDLRKYQRDKMPTQDSYWRHVHTCTRGMLATVSRAKDYRRDLAEGDEFARHRKALAGYIADRRQAQAIDSQIAAVRGLAA